jgi:DNA mismatch endonuclease (patch repair protein)
VSPTRCMTTESPVPESVPPEPQPETPRAVDPAVSRIPAPPPSGASASMRGNRRRDTGPELALRKLLHASGLRYRVDAPVRTAVRLVRPDVVFTRARLAVFVDGCFWHVCPVHGTMPRDPTGYWHAKLDRNVERDAQTTAALTELGWSVLRIWEHVPPGDAAALVEEALKAQRAKLAHGPKLVHRAKLAPDIRTDYTAQVPTSDRLAVSRRIAAPAEKIFALITDPAGQVAIDGSGMLVVAPDATPVRAVGDSFVMDMDRAPLGGDAKYTMVNTITVFDQNRELAWSPALPGRPTVGHIYGFTLAPLGADETEVTNYCDWSAITDAARERLDWPVVPAAMLEQSLVKLELALRAE